MKINQLLGATALVGVLAAFPSAAIAQAAAATTDQEQATPSAGAVAGSTTQTAEAESGQEIIVTGSRISRPNLESTVPITSITGAQLEQTGRVAIGDVLNDLPQLGNTYSQQNSTRFLGTAGLNLLDLYSLGTSRTLVLVNGRRHVGADILNNAVSPDINTFPTDLIDRVDVVTGGNSAVYGSDAIAGVVNFVLKDHYEGLAVHAQGGISEKGDAGSYYGSVLAGKNFADGRGNIAINLEYARQNQFVASQRKDYARTDGFVVVDTDPAGLTNGSDGNPDRVFFRDIRSATISLGGNVLVPYGTTAGPCGKDVNGSSFSCGYVFQPDGTLIPQTGQRVGLAPNGNFIGGNGTTNREGDLVQLLPQLDRYSANLIGHFEVSPAFVPFIEAKYVRTNSFGSGGSGPAFFQGSTLDANLERPRLDNPFLSDQARTLLQTQLGALTVNAISGAAFTDTVDENGVVTRTAAQKLAAQQAAIAAGTFRFALRENLLSLGARSEAARRETYRIVGGVRGTFNGDWKYEVSANYGEFREQTKVQGNLNVQRFLLSLDSTRNAAGQIVCRSQVTPSAGDAANLNGDPNNLLAGDIAACQPFNPFGYNNESQAAKNYVLQDTVSRGKITQLDISGFVSGDLSQLFSLPGGPIGFSIGGEYRRETNQFRADPLVSAGYTFYNAIADFNPTSFEVKEAFGELRVPLLKDFFLAKELTLSGAARVSDYKGGAGTTYAYNGGGDYYPIEGVHFRGNYSRSVRAPNLTELYSPQSQNFAPNFSDPCAARQIGQGSAFRAANCAAAGIPTSYDYIYQQSLQIVSGGNPDLAAEKSDSFTYGVVLQPTATPGLSLSVDYYNIKVKNVITSVDAQTIVNQCYDSPSLSNPFCGSFTRVGAGGTGPGGEEAFRIVEGSLLASPLNYASLKTRGLNTELAYSHRVGENVSLSGKVNWNHQFENTAFTDPTDPSFGDTIVGEVGSPKDQFNVNLDGKFGDFFVNYQVRYLSKQLITTTTSGFYEDVNSFQGRPPQNADFQDIQYYPDVMYNDIRFGVEFGPSSTFYLGVDNLTNRLPPLGSTGIGGGTGIFENVGRRFYAGINAKF